MTFMLPYLLPISFYIADGQEDWREIEGYNEAVTLGKRN